MANAVAGPGMAAPKDGSRRAALGALLAGLFLTVVATAWHARANADLAQQHVATAAAKVAAAIGERMRLHEYGLRGARGAVVATGIERIDPAAFRRYAQTRDLAREFPGARGVGMVRRLAAAEVPAFVADAQRRGRPDFAISPSSTTAGERYVVDLIEPLAPNRAAVGLDIASEATRRVAAQAAMHTGQATLTGPITLVQATALPQRAFLLMLPVYRPDLEQDSPSARQAATFGWVYAPLVIDDVLKGIDRDDGRLDLTLRDVTDGPAGIPFYATAASATPAPKLARTVTMDVLGRRWEAELRPTPQLHAALNLIDPRWTAALGIGLSWVLAALTSTVLRNRHRIAELRLSALHRDAMVTASDDAIVSVSLGGVVTSWNPAAQRLFGMTPEQALGQSLDMLLPDDQKAQAGHRVLARVAAGQVVAPFEAVRRRHDGEPVDVSISAVPLLADGRIVGVAKTYRDIGVRKAAERQLRQSHAELETRVAERTASLEAARRHLQTIIDAVPSQIGYWDRNLVNRFANRAYRHWFGIDPGSVPGRTLHELLGDEHFERSLPLAAAALRGEAQRFEESMPNPGGPGQLHSLVHYLPDVLDGEVRGFYALVHDVTELKESQQQAGAATRKVDALMTMIQQHAIFSVTDRGGRIIDVNEPFIRISGYTRDELIGQTHRVVHSGTQQPGFWRDVWRTIAGGTSWRGEVCNRAKDGSLYWVDSIIMPFVGEKGRVENYISVRFDITQRKAAEAALAARERVMRLVIDAYPGVLAYWDRDTRCVFANRAYVDWLGLEPAQMIGRTQRELLDGAVFARNEPLIHAVLRGQAQTVERHRVTAAGQEVDYLLHYVPDGQGADVQGFISATVDITGRKRAEDEANRTSAQLRAVLDAATEVSIIAVDPDGTVSLFNSGAERLLGYRRDEVLGVERSLSFHDVDELRACARALGAASGRVVHTGMVLVDEAMLGVPHDWTYRRKDGSTVKVSLTVTAMLDGDGHCIGYLGAAHDVSRQKEYERSLQAVADAAQRANLAKSQFLANMSHEIRTPLNALIGVGHLLAGTPLDDDQRQLLARSQVAGRSLVGIVNNVLDLAKIEAGELTLEDAPFSPRDVLGELDAMFRAQADEKGLAYELGCDDDVPQRLVGDALRMRQILVNLVGNAIKFTSHGSVRLRLQLQSQGASLVRLRCSVADTGIGITDEAQTRLFRVFSQADASTTRRYGGSGLGLSIVRQLTQAMGGEVGVSSQPGQGSEFWAVLSLARPAGPVAQAAGASAALEVLVVDDDVDHRQSLAARSRSLGWRTTELESGPALLAHVQRQRAQGAALPDAVLVSQTLHGKSGMQVAESLCRHRGRDPLPAVWLVSADDRPAAAELDPQGLVDGVLARPVESAALFNAVNDSVARRTGHAARVTGPAPAGLQPGPVLAGVRVLVVDDSDVNREVARRLLARAGAEVQSCNSGREALDRLRARPGTIDVVLMDVQMPVMDGLEATRRLRSDLGLTLPVVALTAGALVEERRRAFAAGMTDFLTKPLDPHTLVQTLRRVVDTAPDEVPMALPEAAAPADLSTWPLIEGIDDADAAMRTGNDPELFLSLIEHLRREFADLADPDLPMPGDPLARGQLAARVHKLRGSSGTVGARDVHRLATAAEQALVQPDPQAGAAVAALGMQLRALFLAAAPALAVRGTVAATAASDAACPIEPVTAQECEDLIARVRRQSMSAVDCFQDLEARLHATFDKGVVQDLRHALDDLDFARALGLLEAMG